MKSQLTLLMLCFPLALTNEPALQEFTTGNNLFASEVYSELVKKEPGNFLVSPFSVGTILALTQSGAKDTTGEEVRRVLHLPNQEKIETAVKTLRLTQQSNKLYTLKTANKIYLRPGLEIRDSFKKIATESFDSDFENVDFSKNKEAVATMNQWVEDHTERKITNLISPDSIDGSTIAVLINALYFKSNWSRPFELIDTDKSEFYKSDTETVSVDTLHDTSRKKYFESSELDAKFLELPFQDENATLTIVLPNNKNGLVSLEKNINKVLQRQNLVETLVKIALPKFRVESKMDFKSILQQLGVKKIFKSDEVDLSGVAGNKGEIVVNQVVQKTFIDLNEEGVEAAAATYVDMADSLSDVHSLVAPKEFIVDHPFIFYIRINDLIIFAGRVVDPSIAN